MKFKYILPRFSIFFLLCTYFGIFELKLILNRKQGDLEKHPPFRQFSSKLTEFAIFKLKDLKVKIASMRPCCSMV